MKWLRLINLRHNIYLFVYFAIKESVLAQCECVSEHFGDVLVKP